MANQEYTYAIGRRKTSVASIRLFSQNGSNQINSQEVSKYYPSKVDQERMVEPLIVAELSPKEYYFTAKTAGGGTASQLGAIQLGLARAIAKRYPEKKKALKDAGLLTRDPRMVERKKTGLKKARKAEQYSKR